MSLPETISADYTLRPSELTEVLATLIQARQPTMVWGPPGAAKSMIAQQVASDLGYNYVDIRALLLDPVDLRGIPWRDEDGRTRWAPPVFLPPSDDPDLWLLNLEELPSAVPMVQAALYQLFLERKCGEYELPEGASLIACGNRDADRAVVHRMPTPLSNRLVHLEIRVDARDWCAWGAANGIAPEVLFFIELEPELLHLFEPQSREHAFPSPRSWEFASNIVKHRNGLDPEVERALFRGTVGEAAAVQFTAFLKVWRELPHPRAVINDPENADIPENASTLMALCGSLYRMASDVCRILGVTLATSPVRLYGGGTREKPQIFWTGFWNQGDGASFAGQYSHAKGAAKGIRAHAPKDTELHRIADDLQEVQRRNFWQVRASVRQNGRYCHEYTMAIEVERDSPTWQPPTDGAEDTAIEAMRDLARWLYRQLRSEYEHQTSDDAVDEIVTVNEWTFMADGRRFG